MSHAETLVKTPSQGLAELLAANPRDELSASSRHRGGKAGLPLGGAGLSVDRACMLRVMDRLLGTGLCFGALIGCSTPEMGDAETLALGTTEELSDESESMGESMGEPSETDSTSDSTEGRGRETGDDDSSESEGPNLKPADAPDWVVISVSGHCIPPACDVPGTNHEYLQANGTSARFADALEAWGYSTQQWAYADEFYNRDTETNELLPGEGEPYVYGFLQLHEDLKFIRDTWVADFEDPTKVLVLAHSHGVVWAHTALHVVDDLSVEVAIDFDGKSLGWEGENILFDFGDDWAGTIAAYNDAYGVTWPFDIGDAEAAWLVPGVDGAQDVEDVIPDSLTYNLELQAMPGILLPVPDDDDNHRLDGSSEGIIRFESQSEDHTEIHRPDSEGVDWALTQLAALVVP